MRKFIETHVRYPVGHREKGRVYISFVITKTGKVTDVRIQKGIGRPFDDEAMRVISMLGEFTTVRENGRVEDVLFTVPVFFNPK
ncbi:TonB family protein [Hymenobacter volaticus]|uniref:Energy transducer TonB n=1 Tax=Hymenobacter volaticus TaxID=2932254 RepID=A0ABY4G6D0_9BACT|nr:TonB family protein [Hymenobacter volaticus]UOQ66443.1 energy transducer TonB [Hymenobacter volaticus]